MEQKSAQERSGRGKSLLPVGRKGLLALDSILLREMVLEKGVSTQKG